MTRVVNEASKRITKKYGNGHNGIDIGWRKNESENVVHAHSDGVIVSIATGKKKNLGSTDTASYGNYVKIKHSNVFYTLYAHLSTVYVKVGENVKTGQKIGIIGESGNANGRHLHFEVRNSKDVRIDPTSYLSADLPNSANSCKQLQYQTYDNAKKKWLPNVKTNTNDYAGNLGNAISGLYIDNLEYRVHDKVKNQWLPWVVGRSNYAGNLGNAIDGIQIKNATYRVHLKGSSWLSWINKVDDTSNGYAGIYGKEIDAIQIKS